MINVFESNHGYQALQNRPETPAQVLRMEKNARMGGSVPVWTSEKTQKDKVAGQIASAINGPGAQFGAALAYADSARDTGTGQSPRAFGFGDLFDMVNPFHHVPVVGSIYREITGDTIHPAAKVIGGGLFGGPAGAASGLVNVVVEEETGRDIPGNIVSMARTERGPSGSDPEKVDNPAELPGTTLALTDLMAQGGKPGFKGLKLDYEPMTQVNFSPMPR